MATTTNYGWTTPDDTALVKDGAAAIRTLGSSVDTTTKALNPSTTLGDIEYRSSTANTNTRLGIGSTGNVLTVSGGVPIWAAPAGGGKVLQVVNASTSTNATSGSSTFADTNLTATITPSSATSKILVLVDQTGLMHGSSNTYGALRLLRGATELVIFEQQYSNTGAAAITVVSGSGCNYLDSPATTSATTYKTQFRDVTGNSYVGVQHGSSTSTITLLEIGA
jgi:hypothetical protein